MFQNYFKVAWRSMTRHKVFAAIKIGGFAAGIATCLLIALFVKQELSYDRQYTHSENIYRVYFECTLRGELRKGFYFPAPFSNALAQDFPEIEVAGHYNAGENFGAGRNELRQAGEQESVHEENFIFANQSLADVLEIGFIKGNPHKALLAPRSIIITERKARQYFPNEDPIGKVLILNNDQTNTYNITGVIRDFSPTSHFQSDFIMTLAGKEFWPGEQNNWQASNYVDYIRIREGSDVSELEKKMQSIVGKYYVPTTIENGGDANAIQWAKSLKIKLQPVANIYLNPERIEGDDTFMHGDARYLWLFGAIASFIMLIACINFNNLSTAKSANRAKEVGLRKVAGSQRKSLVQQFLMESLLYSVLSFSLGLILSWLMLPHFNNLMGKALVFPWGEWWLLPVLAGGALLTGLIAGLYPSFYLSSFRPMQVLKGNLSLGSKSAAFRSTLVVFQFTISIILLVGTIVINKQMNFILQKKTGFDKEQVMILEDTHTLGERIQTLKAELVRLGEVQSASVTDFLPLAGTRTNGNPFWLDGRKDIDQGVQAQSWSADATYLATMGIKLVEGRNFIESTADEKSMIINKTMAQQLNLKNPIGATIMDPWNNKFTVIGVINDFHFESMKHQLSPLALMMRKSSSYVLVKIRPGDMNSAIQDITRVWKSISPNQAIRYTFLDQRYAKTYEEVDRIGNVFASFSGLAILVACLGLYALSAFMVEQRGKEISVRIILGATANNVVQLLTQNFVKLVLLSFTIAAPLSWLIMQRWLEDYVYRISFTWDIFMLSGVISILVAFLTVGYQSVKAANMNPATGLRAQ